MNKTLLRKYLEDCKHMISRRALRYDDLSSDKSLNIWIMDDYNSKYTKKEQREIEDNYYNNENLIARYLEYYINKTIFRSV